MKNKIDFKKLKTYALSGRKSKVGVGDFSQPSKSGATFIKFYKSLPNVLAARDFRSLAERVVKAHKSGKMVIFMLGAHVIKCGLSPLVIDLMKRKIVKTVALNGAGSIHDVEIAIVGATSEDVDEAIKDGSFGMAEETPSFINSGIEEGLKKGLGIGKALGEKIDRAKNLAHKELSILACGAKEDIPVTVHVAIGTDIIHQHPSCNGAAIGEGSLIDFRNFVYSVSQLEGGVVINFGSAVILPEVFLKALSVSRNLGHKVTNFTTADFDQLPHYRPRKNVVRRPTSMGGVGYQITGHHELMIPLLYQAIVEQL